MKRFFLFLLACAVAGAVSFSLSAQTPAPAADLNTTYARDEFRLGVQAYNRFSFNESILSFERALAFRPGEPLILSWLGHSYYRSGYEDSALRFWQSAANEYGRGAEEYPLLSSRIETVRNRRSFLPVAEDDVRYVESGVYPGVSGGNPLYRQPTAVLPQSDGSVWVVAYGSNEIVRVDVNGIVRQRSRGPLNGFDRPYDMVRGLDGRLYVSEFRGGRISVLDSDGNWRSYIGRKGRGEGMLIGPQNITIDDEGYLYVVDYGNLRISKYDPDGAFILSFGKKSFAFPGFISPTGIAARDSRIFVADNSRKQIFIFDRNGTYLEPLVSEGLEGPESLKLLDDGRFLAADTNRVLLIDPDSAIIRELGLLGNASKVRIVGAAMDANGNVLAANFDAGEVSLMTRLDDMASGLFLQIDRVIADNFPLITVELRVEDRLRRPIVGLDTRNFLITEGGRDVAEQNFAGAAFRNPEAAVSLLMERSGRTSALKDDLAAAVRDINASLGSINIRSLISAGEQPLRETLVSTAPNGPSPSRLLDAAARGGGGGAYSQRWRFDLGLRLAVTDLLAGAKKRAVIFITSGELGELAFEQYGLSELASYLANNNVVFHAVVVGGGSPSEGLTYLCEQTGGRILPLYRNQGIGALVTSVAAIPSGSYTLTYRSALPTDFGRAYLPVEAEVYLMDRSGRDGTGYFAPLE
ncbi:hypothetical protein FACS1894147_07470 [Spirochaetia bacterium]|nr:hypothetical protein FACS1894147_07470 [Spirochaetia bacterium]